MDAHARNDSEFRRARRLTCWEVTLSCPTLKLNFGEGIVRATGRRAQPAENGSRWFGLKAHARNVPLTADLEMHVSPRGYVGLCRVDGGVVNVCGLFRRRAGEDRRRKTGANCCAASPVRR